MQPQESHSRDPILARILDQKTILEQWIELAPKPPARGANSYDAFISYRSADRAWAMALYDAMKLAGWEPFLDQYELVPGANLETSLIEALEASSSGVIIWSSRTKDSEWCRNERNAMKTLRSRRGFQYLFATLDSEPLPLFAQSDLWEDFSGSPEGPRGYGLLRLLCGMKGEAPSEGAVRFAQRVDEDAKAVMNKIKGAIEADNSERLREIGTSKNPGFLASAGPMTAAARGLISLKDCDGALEVLRDAEAHFPKSVQVKQLKGLALRRLRRFQEAIDVLSELKAAGHQDPETMGILAAAWDGRYQETGKLINLRKSREMYRTAFQADAKSYYTGLNAASKSLFLDEPDEAARLAAEVLPRVETVLGESTDTEERFWAGCSLGELYLLRGDVSAAAKQYQKVIDTFPARVGDLGSTREQAKRICAALKLSEEDTEKVLRLFELLD